MNLAIGILAVWLALNIAIFAGLMLRGPHVSREDRRWMKLHPGMPLHRRPLP